MSVIDDVKQKLDIVQIVSEYADLDTRSRTPKALCPFHAERTPSFVVFPESQTWRCFGACATGGDVIAFLMRRENISFPEALKLAARRAGIEYQTGQRSRDDDAEQSPLVAANEVAGAYFAAMLQSPEGESARAYLEGRAISLAMARRRDLGYCPRGLNTLAGHLRASGVAASAALGAGLVVQTRDGGWRDMFAGRLTIAIRDASGRIIGFGGRSLDGAEPKYLNSPRSEVFDKSSVLYGLNWARDSIRLSGTAVIVEGYMDAITAHEHGFENAVASMGTATTPEQAALLAGIANTVILAFDADTAGQEATLNALETVWTGAGGRSRSYGAGGRRPSLELKVAELDGDDDPDTVIRRSPAEWQAVLEAARPLLDYMLRAYARRYDLRTSDGKAKVAEALFPLIATVENPYEQDRYLTKLAALLGVSVERLQASAPPARRRGRRRSQRAPAIGPGEAETGVILSDADRALEEYLLALLFRHPDLRDYVTALPQEVFTEPANRALFTAWQSLDTLDSVRGSVAHDIALRLDQILNRPLPPADHGERVAAVTQCVQRLHERNLRDLKAQEERVRADVDSGVVSEETRAHIDQRALETNERLRQLFARRS